MERAVIGYKFLTRDATAPFTGFAWPLPGGGPGAWVEAPIEPWLGRVLYEVEIDGEVVAEPTKLVASRARLVRRIDAWDDGLRDAYTRMCADRAHELAVASEPALPDWDAVIEPSVAEGPALLGFVAARIGEERGGRAAYHEERGRQARWLSARLSL
jgi:hypothetical protein